MARHGENIRKRKDGRWEGRYPVYSEQKGKKEYRSVYGRTYEVVKEKLAEKKFETKGLEKREAGKKGENETESLKMSDEKLRAASQESREESGEAVLKETILEKQTEKKQNDIQFLEIMERWLKEVKENKKWSTYVKYSLICRNHLKMPFQNINLDALPEVLKHEREFASLSDSLRKSIYCVLSQILKFASEHYTVTMPILERPAFHIRKKPVEVFSKKDQTRLFSVLYQETDQYKMAVLLCLHTGLRLGELCALKWEDIDMENHLLTVRRTVQRIYAEGCQTKTSLMETAPKSEHSCREIPLPLAVLEHLLSFKKEEEYIFGGNKPLEPRTLQNHFKKIVKEAGAADKNFHALRHTFSTNCIEGGTDVKSLSEMLGHSDVQITLNRYVHPSMDTKRRYLNALWTFYGQIYGHVCGYA